LKFILDTQLLVWISLRSANLSAAARTSIDNPQNIFFFSVVSLWEIAIKTALRKPDFCIDPRVLRRALLDNGYVELPIQSEHTFTAGTLPPVHKDPFDRMLVAQATVEGIMLLTADATIAKYPGPIQKV
jgi:PIN domain nuclease of toxin-antitoxin system